MRDRLMDRRIFSVAALVAITSIPAVLAQAQQGGADGELITELDIEERRKLNQLAPGRAPSRDQVLDELRNERFKIREARKSGVEVSDSEVEEAYAKMAARMRMSAEQLDQAIGRSGVNPETVKQRIRADLAWQRYQQRRRQDPPPGDRDRG